MLILSLMMACNRDGEDFWVQSSDVDGIQDLGILEPISEDEVANNPAGAWSLTGLDGLHYEQLGAPPDSSTRGGATFQFFGTGGRVCVMMDPETVFWNQDISKNPTGFLYQDNLQDDGDLDMKAGLSAYYTGSPGVDIGDFKLPYTDPLGEDQTIDFNECNRDFNPAGRGTIEYCDIDTSTRKGIAFTVLLKTFSLPINDGILNYGIAVVDTACDPPNATFRKNECTIAYEADGGDPAGEHAALEQAFCEGNINDYCAENLGGKNAPCSAGYVPTE